MGSEIFIRIYFERYVNATPAGNGLKNHPVYFSELKNTFERE